jgi:Flp pilus assembly protein TadG
MHTPSWRRTRASDRGASAVEFGLVAPILILMVFGIIQYGLYFFDSVNARQGVREAARQGVVKTFPTCTGASTDWAKLKCNTKTQVGAVTGPVYVKVAAPDGWAKGKRLVVCAVVRYNTGLNFFPMPNDGFIQSKTEMSIEKDTAPTGSAAADTLPAGQTWTWCA